jgi:hypothetical protein
MKLLVTALAGQPAGREPSAAPHQHGAQDDHGEDHGHHGEGHSHGDAGGIEWEDDMVAVNRLTTPANMRWMLVDRTTGAANAAIDWHFTEGDRVKIRLVNEMDSDHPCTTRSTCTGPAGSWCWPGTGSPSPTWSGRTPCWSAPGRP